LKVADLSVPHLHLASLLGVTGLEFRQDFWLRKPEFLLCGTVASTYIQPFDTIPANDTDGQIKRDTDARPVLTASIRASTAFRR